MRDNTAAALDSITAYSQFLRNEIPVTIAHIEFLMADGLAAHRTDGPGTHSGSHESPVERVVLKREPANLSIRNIGDELDAAAKTLRNLLRDCRDIRKVGRKIEASDGEPTRCNGGAGREGYLIPRNEGGWSHPDCNNIVKGVLTCDRCRQAASRWTRNSEVA